MTSKPDAFECKMCGHCCHGQGGIVLEASDVARLCAFLALDEADFLARYTEIRNGKPCLITRQDGFCVFFKDGCSVHEFKPAICQAWPFFKGNLVDKSSWRMAQDYCPGINASLPHEEFATQGITYLRRAGLLRKTQTGGPNALVQDPDEKK